ncbi:MAG: M20 family metallopeptidase [Proteobacteria bacterium]|nr:M20 family metallopeptidase [Pseudomonadota bacterium]
MKIPPQIVAQQPELMAIRRDIHANPETAFEELRTSNLVAAKLESWGIEVHKGLAKTGIVGKLAGGRKLGRSARAIGLRADMDALPIHEKNAFGYRSKNDGRMHACGHDGHTAMLLGAAKYLAESRNFDGTVYFIFQPAEEGQGGGREMIEDGLFEKFQMDAVFGMHNWPGIPAGQFAVMPGPMMASTDNFEIRVIGRGAHAAMPQNGIDPILIGSELVQALQSISSRTVSPLDAAVVSVTQFHAGEVINAIPSEAILRGTARSFKPGVRDTIENAIKRLAAGIAAAHGASASVQYDRLYPPTINAVRETEIVATVLENLVGSENVLRNLQPSTGAEDFAFMLLQKPGCYLWIGNGPGDNGCMLHNASYDFNDEILPLGSSAWVRLTEHMLAV